MLRKGGKDEDWWERGKNDGEYLGMRGEGWGKVGISWVKIRDGIFNFGEGWGFVRKSD